MSPEMRYIRKLILELRSCGINSSTIAEQTGLTLSAVTSIATNRYKSEVGEDVVNAMSRLHAEHGPQAATRLMPRFATGCSPRYGR